LETMRLSGPKGEYVLRRLSTLTRVMVTELNFKNKAFSVGVKGIRDCVKIINDIFRKYVDFVKSS
ncbi:hypothetical protein, partial [Brevibacillus sp. MCWH]|uniref:hypothetical protein n=1 Tax=Brevibacillus sp. MCWH TaxID=2508871 RepID=UPI001C0EDBDE